jgi:hypothetical protein
MFREHSRFDMCHYKLTYKPVLLIAQNTPMKRLFLITFLGLILGNFGTSRAVWASNDGRANIHIDRSYQFPATRWANADHFIRVHVPHNAEAIRVLKFSIPENLRFTASQVEILTVDGQKIPANVTDIGRVIQIEFAKSIGQDTQFDVHIKNVTKISVSRPAIYALSAQLGNGGQAQFVGEAYFRSY